MPVLCRPSSLGEHALGLVLSVESRQQGLSLPVGVKEAQQDVLSIVLPQHSPVHGANPSHLHDALRSGSRILIL